MTSPAPGGTGAGRPSDWLPEDEPADNVVMFSEGGTALGTIATVVISIIAAVGVLAAALIVFLMWRFKLPPRALVAMIAAAIYLVSPIDVLPEVLLGPVGLLDDAGVVTGTAIFVYKLIQTRKRLIEAGVLGRGRPSGRRTRPFLEP